MVRNVALGNIHRVILFLPSQYHIPPLFSIIYHLRCLIVVFGSIVNPLRPTGHVMHHQFNIQQLYALPTLYLCVLYLSENKQRLVPLTA